MKNNGPLFIVGMPRSGTKLLRDLLNQHPQISIPEVETHFIPLFIKRYGKIFDFKNGGEDVFNDFERTSFFYNSQVLKNFDPEAFEKDKPLVHDWQSFGFLVFKSFGPQKNVEEVLYGDKTPGYIKHLHLLKEIFPDAKFIHIIRDPRDFCISVKSIWNKNMYRAADTWNRTLAGTAGFKDEFAKDYVEVRYEDLISDIDKTMKNISSFVDVEFDPAMTMLKKTAENYGAARGETNILKNNKEKYLQKLSKRQIEKIENITYSQLVRLEYKVLYAREPKRLGKLEMSYFKFGDAINSMAFHIKEKGLKNGLSYFFKLHKQSSWR